MISLPGIIPIRIHPIFWLMAFGIGWLSSQEIFSALLWVVVITVSVLVHEFGHALTAKAFGQRVQIDLVGMGGLTLRRGGKLTSIREFLIVLNGPLAGFALFIASSLLYAGFGKQLAFPIAYMLQVSILVNLWWTLLNLLPVQPLDGGQLLRIILESIFGLKGVKFALFLSMVISASLSLFFLWQQQLFAGAIFLLLTYEGYRTWQSSLQMTESDQKGDLQKELSEAEREIRYGDLEKAREMLVALREKSKTGIIHLAATQYLADLFNEQQNYKDAYDLLSPIENSLSPDSLMLLHQLTYRRGDLKKTVEIGNKLYQQAPSYDVAIINAYAHALQGEAKQTVGWVQCAEREGLPNLKEVLQKPEFDKVRKNELFQAL